MRSGSRTDPADSANESHAPDLYFDASGAAGLIRAYVGAAAGLITWLAIGAVVTRWYDRRGLHRASPTLLEHIDAAVCNYYREAPAGSRR